MVEEVKDLIRIIRSDLEPSGVHAHNFVKPVHVQLPAGRNTQ